ncbi:MAG TPA: GNAT family N-acetyltransferase [Xanthomonadales bacterium]|nr:GNAT family N-acetyltransferase [Xanthomonadales bacterium]
MIESLDQKSTEIATQIHNVFQRSYRLEAELIGVTDFPPLKRTRQHIQDSPTCFVGAWVGSDLAAVIEYTVVATVVSIDSLVVDPDYFRRGLGSQLVQHVIQNENWDMVEVETARANAPAISLYEQSGFHESRSWKTAEGILKVQLVMTHSTLDP